jgi:hypothetical protein
VNSLLSHLRSALDVRDAPERRRRRRRVGRADAKVFTKYAETKLQMKREVPQKLNRAADESAEFWDRRDDELGVFLDSRQESWHSSGTVFARKAQRARKPNCRKPQ